MSLHILARPAHAQASTQACKTAFDRNEPAFEAAAGKSDGRASIKRIMADSGCRDVSVSIARPPSNVVGKPRVVIGCWIINDRIHSKRMVVDV